MERRAGANTWLIAALALVIGFVAALLIFRGSGDNASSTVAAPVTVTATATTTAPTSTTTSPGATTTTTTTTTGGSAPQQSRPTVGSCVALWNQPTNRGDQTFLVNVMSQQPIRVHVGTSSDVPPKCVVTVVANNGNAYVFPQAAGNAYPYAQAPGATPGSSLPADQRTSNALEQSDGTLKAS